MGPWEQLINNYKVDARTARIVFVNKQTNQEGALIFKRVEVIYSYISGFRLTIEGGPDKLNEFLAKIQKNAVALGINEPVDSLSISHDEEDDEHFLHIKTKNNELIRKLVVIVLIFDQSFGLANTQQIVNSINSLKKNPTVNNGIAIPQAFPAPGSPILAQQQLFANQQQSSSAVSSPVVQLPMASTVGNFLKRRKDFIAHMQERNRMQQQDLRTSNDFLLLRGNLAPIMVSNNSSEEDQNEDEEELNASTEGVSVTNKKYKQDDTDDSDDKKNGGRQSPTFR